MRIGAAIAAVPLAAIAAVLAWFVPVVIAMTASKGFAVDASILPMLGVGLIVATLGVVIVGVPTGLLVAWVLRKTGKERSWSYPLAGAVVGAVLALPVGLFGEFALSGAAAGVVLGLAWWRFVRGPQLAGAAHV